jgi:hypothetical protein
VTTPSRIPDGAPVVRTGRRLALALSLTLTSCTGGQPTPAADNVGATGAEIVNTCDRFATVPIDDGRYMVQQNEWNSADPQCIAVTRRSWTVTRASFQLPTDGPPASYPSVFRGCHWGTCTVRDPLPVRIADIAEATSSWRTAPTRWGAYDIAYDLWTNSAQSTAEQPNGSEIMIWLKDRGGVRPAGSPVGGVRIGGARWTVWTIRMSSWNYIAYRRRRPTESVSSLDLAAFIHDSVERGLTEPSWYLIAVEAGYEIWRRGRGLASRSFSMHVRRTGAMAEG